MHLSAERSKHTGGCFAYKGHTEHQESDHADSGGLHVQHSGSERAQVQRVAGGPESRHLDELDRQWNCWMRRQLRPSAL